MNDEELERLWQMSEMQKAPKPPKPPKTRYDVAIVWLLIGLGCCSFWALVWMFIR